MGPGCSWYAGFYRFVSRQEHRSQQSNPAGHEPIHHPREVCQDLATVFGRGTRPSKRSVLVVAPRQGSQ